MGLDSAGDQPSRGFGLPGTSATTEVGAIDLNRPRAVRVNRPYLFCLPQYDQTTNRSRVIEFYCDNGLCGVTGNRLRL